MDAALNQDTKGVGAHGIGAGKARAVGGTAVRVRPDLMAGLGVAAKLARLATRTAASPARNLAGHHGRSLRTERLWLRPLTADDRTEFLRVLGVSAAHLAEFCPLGAAEATTDEQVFARQLALSEAAERTGWATCACRLIAMNADGRIVGGFNVNDIERGLEHSGELVFWLSADAQRRGYAEEGLRALMELALADLPLGLGLHRLRALIAPGNDACRRLARKVGLRLSAASPPMELVIGDRRIAHDVFETFAAVGESEPAAGMAGRMVEGKPSVVEELFGRGLLSILRTEKRE